MKTMPIIRAAIALTLASGCSLALAALPPPTPAEAAAQATKKAAADAQAAKDKESLLASMDALNTRWRGAAKAKGLTVHPPTPIAAPAVAVTMPAKESGPAGQPDGKLTAAGAAAPKTSEKAGTAAPSKDVKPAPSPAAATVKTVK
jgi:colicin import membrane protein